MRTPALLIAICLPLLACSSNPKNTDNDNAPSSDAEVLYDKAKRALDSNQFEAAIAEFENLEATYPFGDHAQQAQLDVTFAYYKQGEFDNALAGADRFLKLYPQSDHSDYAWYLKGLINFSRGKSLFEKFVPRKPYKLDQAWLRNAFNDFSTLLRKYPQSVYVSDARQRMVFLRNEMARHELSIARYYYKRTALVAAINRLNFMLDQFADTPYSGDGLALLANAYLKLGNKELASDTVKTLELNNPDHPELQKLKKRA